MRSKCETMNKFKTQKTYARHFPSGAGLESMVTLPFSPGEGQGMRHIRILITFILLALLISSCVPNRKIVYLQKDDVNKKDLMVDSVLRSYDLQLFDYKIQPNDVLNIRFGSLTDDKFDFLNKMQQDNGTTGTAAGTALIVNGFLVDPDGSIAFPVVGKTKVAGLNIFEIQAKLQTLANRYLESPSVRVRLVNFRFTVLGEVLLEGTTVSFNNRVTLLEAIGLAGGLTDLADRSKVKLVRMKGGKLEVAYINLLSENFINSPYYFMNQSDIIIVPPLRQRPFRKYFGQNIAFVLSAISLVLVIVTLYKK